MTAPILTVSETGSTNADLLALAAAGSGVDGLWLRAELQTAGRGRQGRAWSSPAGNLSASTLVHVASGDPPAATLALVAAVATADAFGRCGLATARIKWPNDLMVEGAKLAGILLERAGGWVVIGIGANLAAAPEVPGRAVTCLAAHAADVPTPDRFLALLADQFAAALATWRERGLAATVAAWLERAHPLGTPLAVALPDGGALHGSFAGLAPDGALILRLADGATRAIHAGDVFLV